MGFGGLGGPVLGTRFGAGYSVVWREGDCGPVFACPFRCAVTFAQLATRWCLAVSPHHVGASGACRWTLVQAHLHRWSCHRY